MGDSGNTEDDSQEHDARKFSAGNKQREIHQKCGIVENEGNVQRFVDAINVSKDCKNIGIQFGPCKMFKGKLGPVDLKRLLTYRLDHEEKTTHETKYD